MASAPDLHNENSFNVCVYFCRMPHSVADISLSGTRGFIPCQSSIIVSYFIQNGSSLIYKALQCHIKPLRRPLKLWRKLCYYNMVSKTKPWWCSSLAPGHVRTTPTSHVLLVLLCNNENISFQRHCKDWIWMYHSHTLQMHKIESFI